MTLEASTSTFPFSDQIARPMIDSLMNRIRPMHKCIHQALQLDNIVYECSLQGNSTIHPLMDHIVQLNFTQISLVELLNHEILMLTR